MSLKILITGGTTGIGFSLAKYYCQRGHEVTITGRDKSKVDSNALKMFNNLFVEEVDVTDREKMRDLIEKLAMGGLDLVIANAGVAITNKTKKPDFSAARTILDINVLGLLNTFEPAIDYFVKVNKGHLVGISSVAGEVGLPGAGAYCGSKAYVTKLCESFRIDLAKFNISVTAIAPGFIDTPLTRKNPHPMPFLISSDDAAQKIANAIGKKKVFFAFPLPMRLIIWLLKFLPRIIYVNLFKIKALNFSKE